MDHAVGVQPIPGIADLIERVVVIHHVKELDPGGLQRKDVGAGIALGAVIPVGLFADQGVRGTGQILSLASG